MIYHSKSNSSSYFPPILGNGDLSFPVDCEGSVCQTKDDYPSMVTFDSVIYRAGRRTAVTHAAVPGKILSFGKLRFLWDTPIDHWSQELLEQDGLVQSTVCYQDGSEIDTLCFIHPEKNLYAVRKTFRNLPAASKEFVLQYNLCGYDQDSQNVISNLGTSYFDNGFLVNFRMFGQDIYTGQARIWSDTPAQISTNTLRFQVQEGQQICLFFCLEDDLKEEDYQRVNQCIYNSVQRFGFNGMLQETIKSWNAYHQRSYIQTPNETLNGIYRVALYHLRCYTTQWSIPVGINNSHWDGRYFAFDEYDSFLGLLGANQASLAKHVPLFRLNVCLEKAISRNTNQTDEQARFPWETNEYGDERAPTGYWMDHVFHMCVVALGAYEYYEYTQDAAFLRDCYRMIRACAKFFTLHMLYKDGERLYIGKCTDLERLGSSVENAFMTTCGVIKTLEICSHAAEILDIDPEYRQECLIISQKLRESLPVEDGRYVPHPGCKQKSVAVFSGQFPFQVLDPQDSFQLRAWDDFIANEENYGNMYAGGKRVSPWYACWKAEAFARIGRSEEVYQCLCQASESIGVFHEMFEINEVGKQFRPWFTTASGILMSAINDALVQSDGLNIHILPAYPCEDQDLSFKLAVKGGAVLEVEIRHGELVRTELTGNTQRIFHIHYKNHAFMMKATQ